MAKIVILGSGADSEAAAKALEAANIEFEVVEPTAANLLHLVIGIVDNSGEEPEVEEPAAEVEEPEADEPADEEPVPESLGTVIVDGQAIEAIAGSSTVLHVTNLTIGSRTTYAVNESVFSFWPSDIKKPMQRIVVESGARHKALEVEVVASSKKAFLCVGPDLKQFLKTK